MTLRTTSAHWIIHDGVGVRLAEASSAAVRLPCISTGAMSCARARVLFSLLPRGEVPFRKWENTKNLLEALSTNTGERKCRRRRSRPLRRRLGAFFSRDFSRRYRILKFYRSYWRRPAVPNVFPISVTGFRDVTNAPQINRAHYLPGRSLRYILYAARNEIYRRRRCVSPVRLYHSSGNCTSPIMQRSSPSRYRISLLFQRRLTFPPRPPQKK